MSSIQLNSFEQMSGDASKNSASLDGYMHNLPLSHRQTSLCDTLSIFLHTAAPLREEMEESVDRLKEAFLNILHEVMSKKGIDLQERLALGLDGNILRLIDASHSRADDVEAVLSDMPKLAEILRQIAADTLVLRSLDTLEQAFGLCVAGGRGRHGELVENYQVCLKGDLSHFYYV